MQELVAALRTISLVAGVISKLWLSHGPPLPDNPGMVWETGAAHAIKHRKLSRTSE